MAAPSEIVLLSGARTPFGKFGGALRAISATELGVSAARAALARAAIEPQEVDHVIFGNVLQSSPDAVYLARHVGLKSGVPQQVPGLTVNRLCGSGLQAIIAGAQMILLGEAEVVLAGGAENMSQAPHAIRGARWGIPFGAGTLEDTLWTALTDSYCKLSMAETAENLARRYAIGRAQADEFAWESQMRTRAARQAGRFGEIAALPSILDADEHPRAETSQESLARLPPAFRRDGIVTAGNASGIVDGAAAVVLSRAEWAGARGIAPLATLVSWGIAGCDPEIMGIGPVPAIRQALQRASVTLAQIDRFEINEAFACQYLAVEKELGLERSKVNVNGGAIALGHPLGATGARLAATLMFELSRSKTRYGVASACIGGGQGIAVLLERNW